jgi:hypothetical protein
MNLLSVSRPLHSLALSLHYIPVDARLPCSVGEAIEHVQNKRATEPRVGPVLLRVEELCRDTVDTCPRLECLGPPASVSRLEFVTASPNNHDQSEQRGPCNLGTHRTAHTLEIESKAKDVRPDNLHGIVNHAVESSRSRVEVSTVDFGEVVRVEPVGRQEHGKQGQDVRVGEKRLPETHDFRGPSRVLHDDDFGAVATNDILGVDEGPCKPSTDEREDQESDVGTVADSCGFCGVDALAERNLQHAC